MKNIYAIVGDYYHQESVIREALDAALQPKQASGEWQLTYIAVEELTVRLAEKPEAVILFKEDRLNPTDAEVATWLTAEVSDRIVRYVEEGGGFFGWHSGLASYASDTSFVRMLRGEFEFHPSQHQLVNYSGTYPGTQDQVEFEILDEHYFVRCDEGNTNVFLRSSSIDGDNIGGWAHDYGQGKVICLTPAHNPEGLKHPVMLELLRQCLAYCLRG
jgi:type 1 glutamine amidotransferase